MTKPQLYLKSMVGAPHEDVFRHFDQDFFNKLTPFFFPFKSHLFEGTHVGACYHFEFGFGPLKGQWKGHITESRIEGDYAVFVDEGLELPFPLKSWRHYHEFFATQTNKTIVVDRIEFECANDIGLETTKTFLYPLFVYRHHVIRKTFGV